MAEEKEKEELPKIEETVEELKKQLEKALKEKEEYLSGWQRAKAEFLAYQQEEEKRKQNYILLANFNLMSEILNVLDSFELAISQIKDENTLQGIGLIKSQLEGILKKHGLEVIEPKEGEKFNPHFHEVLFRKTCERENCDESDDGVIYKIFTKGYLLHGTLLRPAQVAVIYHKSS
jgi:molecular chaperone GrpE